MTNEAYASEIREQKIQNRATAVADVGVGEVCE